MVAGWLRDEVGRWQSVKNMFDFQLPQCVEAD